MTPVRPSPFPAVPQAPQGDTARLAAQKAFFEVALGRAAAPAVTAAPVDSPPVARAQRTPDLAAAAPTKVLRPGSLLDIRV